MRHCSRNLRNVDRGQSNDLPFELEMLRRLQLENPRDEFLTWQPGDKAPSTELEVLIAVGKVGSKEIEAQTKLGLLRLAESAPRLTPRAA